MTTYDRQGSPISLDDWQQRTMDPGYVCLQSDTIGSVTVHTVWSGVDRATNIVTIVIEHADGVTSHGIREAYSDEKAALAGHARWVETERHRLSVVTGEATSG